MEPYCVGSDVVVVIIVGRDCNRTDTALMLARYGPRKIEYSESHATRKDGTKKLKQIMTNN